MNLNCPACGAAMHVAGNRRHFQCDHCGRLEFPEETSEGITPIGKSSHKCCPVCHVAMEKALLEGEDVRYCSQCRGFMTQLDAFGRIVGKRRAQHHTDEQITEPFDPVELKRILHCPYCENRMEAHPFGGGGNAVVDTCHHCQFIWLDAGELFIIERYVPYARPKDPVLPLSQTATPCDPVPFGILPVLGLDELF